MANEKEVSFVVRIKDAGSAVLNNLKGSAADVTEKLFSFKDILKEIAGVAGAFSLAALVKDMIDLGVASDATFRQIAASLPTFTDGIDGLRDGIDKLAQESGRSLEDMQRSAAEIAKLGVGSAGELQQVLTAATKLADGTGASVDESAQLLIQLRREFNLDGNAALDLAAKMADIARGKLPLTDLTAAFATASPAIHKAGVDVDTAVAAISALLDPTKGAITTTRELRTALNDLTPQGWKDLAAQASINADALDQLNKRAKETEDSAGRAGTRVKNEFSKSLENLGTIVLPALTLGLNALRGAMEWFEKSDFLSLTNLKLLLSGDWKGFVANVQSAYGIAAPGQTFGGSGGFGGTGTSGTFGGPPAAGTNKPFQMPLGAKELAALEEAKKKLAELGVDFDRLAASATTTTSKSQQFALAIEAYTQKAHAAHLPTDALANDLDTLNGVLQKLQQQEAAEAMAKDAKATQDAFDSLAGALAKFSGDAVEKLDAEMNKVTADLERQRDAMASDADREQMTAGIAALRDRYKELRVAVVDAIDAEKGIDATRDLLDRQTMSLQQITDLIGVWSNRAADVRAKMEKATDKATLDQYKKELDEIKQLLKDLGIAWDNVGASTDNSRKHLLQMAQDWSTIGRSVIAAGQAVGAFNGETAAALQNVVSLGDGILRIAGGDTVGGAAELVTSLAALAKGLFGQSPAQQQQIKVMQDNTAALRHLADRLSSVSGTTQNQAAAAFTNDFWRSLALQVAKQGGGTVDINKLGLTGDQIDALNAAAKAYGITLDGSVNSFLALKAAVDQAGKALGKYGTDYQSAQSYYAGLADVQGLTGVDAFNVNALAGASQSPFLAQLLAGQNLNTQEGRDALKKQLQDAFQRGGPGSSNPFTTEELGGLSVDQMEQAIQQWADALNQLPPIVQSAADKLKTDLADLSQKAAVLGEDPVQQLADRVKVYAADLGPAFAQLAAGLDLTKQSDIDAFQARLRAFYQGLDDGTVTVDTSVMSIEDWKAAIADVSGAVTAAAGTFKSAADKINASLNQIDVTANIEGTSPEDVLQQKAKAQGFGVLGNYDLTTQSGRDAAKAELKSIFENGLSPTDSNFAQWSSTISSLITAIDQLPALAGVGGASLVGIPAMTDTYNQSAQATVTSISAAEATGILGEIQTSNTFLSALPQIRDLLSKWVAAPAMAGVTYGGGVGAPVSALAASIGPIVLPVYLDGKQIGEAVANSLLDPAVYHSFDRSNTLASKRVQSGLGLPRT